MIQRFVLVICLFACFIGANAAVWETMFSYNKVNQIAVTRDKVYAVSDGALFSVEKYSERLEKYDAGSGLHGTTIGCIGYAKELDMLIIGYEDGKIDLLKDNNVTYVSGLYTKDMMATKNIHNITIRDNFAYLSTDFGIVTFNLNKYELVDTYFIGNEASEVKVNDILFRGDTIFAFTDDWLYKANTNDNIVDYRFWSKEPLGRVRQDTNKGKIVTDSNGERWEAGGTDGIIRITIAQKKLTYKPDGPLVNTPYCMRTFNGRLYVVPGGRWGVQYLTPGCVMVFDGQKWHNISQATIRSATGNNPATDFMDVAVDPNDPEHFFVTAYGGGVYEFQNYQPQKQYLPSNSSLVTRVDNAPTKYTRCTGGAFDSKGNYWCLNTSESKTVHRFTPNKQWYGITLTKDGNVVPIYTTAEILLDKRNENHKWIVSCREGTKLLLLDDNGTINEDDDKIVFRDTWTTANGNAISPLYLYTIKQDANNNIWIGSSSGPIIIPANVDFSNSDMCRQIEILDEDGNNLFQSYEIRSIEFDNEGQIWLGTSEGAFVVSNDWKKIVAQYNSANTIMPGSSVMSLAFDAQSKYMYIGTSNGIVRFNATASSGSSGTDNVDKEDLDYGSVQRWRPHFSYTTMKKVIQSNKEVYALADGVVFSLNKTDESLTEWNKSTGLSSSTVTQLGYDKKTDKVILCYSDGKIDLIDSDDEVTPMLDLFQKASSIPVTVNSLYVHNGRAYLSMAFGIVVLDLAKAEVEDTYYIGENASNVDIKAVTILNDTIYAISKEDLYAASLQTNLVDFNYWHTTPLPEAKSTSALFAAYGHLYIVQEQELKILKANDWSIVADTLNWVNCTDGNIIACQYGVGLIEIKQEEIIPLIDYHPADAIFDPTNQCYWLAVNSAGICKLTGEGKQFFSPAGPISNYGYRLKYIGNELFIAGGERWGVQKSRVGNFSIYNGRTWRKMYASTAYNALGVLPRDVVSFAGKADKPGHFFAACYGQGVYEYNDYKPVQRYTHLNSTLQTAVSESPNNYTRTEGTMIDEQGNLWVLNTENATSPINIMTPAGNWVGLSLVVNGNKTMLKTPWEIVVDQRDGRYKWIIDQREDQGVFLFYDNGTPTNNADDRCVKRKEFYDQDGLQIAPAFFYCLVQDKNNDIWIGTPTGLFIIPSTSDFFTSNECYRVKIPRNDGTNLADYLLGSEQVNCIAVDGGNRKWIGTANSGLYLMSEDGLTTEAHFTTENSLLPSNNILSIAIHPITGEVFAGTGEGIASYCSDASEGRDDYSQAYAFPNPVRPDYAGSIAITGLMENSVVNIVDEGGNLICKTRSNGGTAVWDGKNQQGKKASSGIYTALCNAPDGSHTAIKIMVMK